ncbi:MAG: hypothetical protein HY900_06305 [Deltaproteobacteria bacterium]|nr:hypothetical protein [Deltaproteobacteria bacterium]
MLRQTAVVLIGFLLGQSSVLADTGPQGDSLAYTIGFSTYLSHIDRHGAAFDIVTDGKGSIYISGNTRDRNFPTTDGAFQRELKGEADAFVAKFTPEGKLAFATLIGGTKREHHTGLAVDDDGYVYLVGGTHSADFPVTVGAYDPSFNGEKDWGGDVYVTKIHPSGSGIVWSTFIGGSVQETATGIAVDRDGSVVIAGTTASPDFPTTTEAIRRRPEGNDGFLARVSPEGDSLLSATLIGGNREDGVTGLAIDDQRNIFISGHTASTDLPATPDAVRQKVELAEKGGFENGIDLFLAKVNEKGTAFSYLSYIGGRSFISTDLSWTRPGKLMICGSTNSKSLPLSANAYSKEPKGERDGFIAVFDSASMKLEYATLFGGSQFDFIRSGFFLNEDRVVISGETNSPDLPLTGNALNSAYPVCDKTFNNTFFGKRKFFVSVIDIKKGRLLHSTFFGSGVRFQAFPDKQGNLGFVAEAGVREVPATDFPVSSEAFRVPPTYFMVGRLILGDSTVPK